MRIDPRDNVEVSLETGHKTALTDIKEGENIIKYGFPIGRATRDIKKGELVHTHNLKTNLEGVVEYTYTPREIKEQETDCVRTFMGYQREDGSVGIRNEVWIINTVGCVNKVAQRIAEKTGAESFAHPFGCSQLGDDFEYTQKILKGLVNHPNAAGVLVLGLGCENNNIEVFKKFVGEVSKDRVKLLCAQDSEDEIAEGIEIVKRLQKYADTFKRREIPVSRLKVGLKCGGSDAFSGITANPLVGRFSDILTSCGGSTVLTEVPEMFGAETILMERAQNKEVFDKIVRLINDFKNYFLRHNQVIYENPSPGNKAGGITTLEEKSLGCIQKGGSSAVVDVLDIGDTVVKSGLNLLNGPGNDIVATTNLTASGAHLILFTTGRGTPVGAPVPTVKISSNSRLFESKPGWIDFDAGALLSGKSLEQLSVELFDYVLSVASGERTRNEINGYKEISIFKDGIIL
ncbi:MAG TPA: altronate dehydratase family protein [Candidatus Avimonas sp.]|jgi:altronate hydrolase|nr:altronate dehydratase [Clostridiales bacterium]HOB36700.1 altronate dehydratase family protein [Candidatus Avimonas sp.]HQA15928.1 altronate dehydratase family protein [Candidatus Avimonas sp.]HQD37697.1 altronate dehydratase family protein [Candidatus Avimonas sp.]